MVLNLIGAELMDRNGTIELIFADPADGAVWRVSVRSMRVPEVPPRPEPAGVDPNGPPRVIDAAHYAPR